LYNVKLANDNSNSNYYRNYGVHIFSTPNVYNQVQIHLLKDFEIIQGEVKVKPNRYVVVSLLLIEHADDPDILSLVSSCTACPSRVMFPIYWVMSKGKQQLSGPQELYSCRHIYPVISSMTFKMGFRFNTQRADYKDLISRAIATHMTITTDDFQPDSWYMDTEITYNNPKKGKLSIYVTECFDLLCVSQQIKQNGTRWMHCYECPRSNGCTHTGLIPNNHFYDLNDLPDLNGIVLFT
jgi:hypothetical protein